MAYGTLIVEIEDYVALIRLNRPEALNALNSRLVAELVHAIAEAGANDKVRCLVITGSEKAFAAGADIKEMSTKTYVEVFTEDFFGPLNDAFRRAKEVEVFTEDFFGPLNDAFRRARKPIIAAVSGFALGGGCELAMMCDFIIAADTAKFGQPEINLGVIAGIGGTQRLTRFVGKSKSMDMHLTGRFMDAAEAERSGLVSRVVAANKLIPEALAAARKIAEKSQLAAMAAKEAVNRSYETTMQEGLLFERRLFHGLFATEDQKEGMSAFLEKRTPQFRDR